MRMKEWGNFENGGRGGNSFSLEKGREGNNTWVSRVWEALKRDLSAGFAKNPLVVGWNLLMCVRKHLHHPGGGEWLPRAGAERGTRCSCRIPRPGISPLPVLSALTVHRCSLSGGSLGAGDVPPAARVTFWLGKELFLALGQKRKAQGSLQALRAVSLFVLLLRFSRIPGNSGAPRLL